MNDTMLSTMNRWDLEALAESLRTQLADVTRERNELAEWEKSQLEVESEWSTQDIARLLGMGLGESIRKNLRLKIETLLSQRDAANARAESAEAERDKARSYEDLMCKIKQEAEAKMLESQAQAAGLRDALERQHRWHIDQTDRTPLYFGDTIGQVDADEYGEGELYEITEKALEKSPAEALRAHDLALVKEFHDTATSILMHRTTLGHYTLKDITSIIDQALAEVTEDTLSGGKEGA